MFFLLQRQNVECAIHSKSVTTLDLSYETSRVLFSQWPNIVSIFIDSNLRYYMAKWMLPESMNVMKVSNELLLDLKMLRSGAMLEMLRFATSSPKAAYKLAHGFGSAVSSSVCEDSKSLYKYVLHMHRLHRLIDSKACYDMWDFYCIIGYWTLDTL